MFTWWASITTSYFSRGREEFFAKASRTTAVKTTLIGFQRLYDKLHPMSERLKLAFGMDLARLARVVMEEFRVFEAPSRSEAEVQLRRVACTSGEHICKKNGTPAGLTRNNITFLDYSGHVIPYQLIGAEGYTARKMTINTLFSKTDHSGFGRRPWHERQLDQAKEEVCVVTLVERWIAITRDLYGAREDSELYDVPGFERVSVNTLHEIMQNTTIQAAGGVKIDRLSTTHSLRYGGATMMASAGFPQYLIAHYGGWAENSSALKKYIRPSDASIAMVSEYMTTMAFGEPSRHYIEDASAARKKGSKK